MSSVAVQQEEEKGNSLSAAAAGDPQLFGTSAAKAPKRKRVRKKHAEKRVREVFGNLDLNTTPSNGQEETKDVKPWQYENIKKKVVKVNQSQQQ